MEGNGPSVLGDLGLMRLTMLEMECRAVYHCRGPGELFLHGLQCFFDNFVNHIDRL